MRGARQEPRGRKVSHVLGLVVAAIAIAGLDFVWLLTVFLLETCDTCGADQPPTEGKRAVAFVAVLASWAILGAVLMKETKVAACATLATLALIILGAVVR